MDYQIDPDPGSINPWQSSAASGETEQYTVVAQDEIPGSSNALPIAPGHAFSVEPGIYLPGRWGMRLEDIVVATEQGPLSMNFADHALVTLG